MADAPNTDAHWLRVKELFDGAIEQAPDTLPAWLDSHCGGDDGLRRQLESLVAAHHAAGGFIETPAIAASGAARAVADTLATEVKATMIGRRLGAYRIVSELDRGGMGVVYLAERDDEAFHTRVAIKMMQGGLSHPALVARFEAERRILASLEHPNIARLLDAGADERGTPFAVMEYVEGTPIDVYVRERHLSVSQMLELFCLVCGAVQYSHQRLVVHRDIKARNLLVTRDGVPKLLDFGIAKLLDASEVGAEPTRTNFRALTPESASPEQVRGGPITVASDVYSLGALLYKLLAGRSPYRSHPRTDTEIVRAICEEDPPRPSDAVSEGAVGGEGAKGPLEEKALSPHERAARRRELVGDLDLITIKALRKEPERRYASVERLAEDVRRHLRGEPVEAAPDSRRYRTAKFLRRHRAGVAGAAVVAGVIVAGLAGTLWEARAASVERERAVRRFNDVRSLARSVIFELHDAIEPLPGSTAARELLVRRALGYLDRLASEGDGGDPSLQRELAEAYMRIGDVQGNPSRNNLGHTKASLDSYRKALDILQRLARARPSDRGVLDELARAHRAVGGQLSRVGDPKSALDQIRSAIAIHERLAAERPGDASLQVALATSYQGLGDALVDLEDWPRVLAMRQKALPPIRLAAERAPGDVLLQRSLALAWKRLGAIQVKLQHGSEGLDAYQKALAIDEARLAADPDSAEARMDVSFGVSDIGLILWQNGDRRAALRQYARAREIREGLSRADPKNERMLRALAGTLARMGLIQQELGEHDTAVANLCESLKLVNGLAANDPASVPLQVELAQALERLGTEDADLASAGRVGACADARPLLVRALAVYRSVAARGSLAGDDAGTPARVEGVLARCGPGTR